MTETSSDFQLEGVVRGHHVFKSVWTPVVGEDLPLQQEPDNSYDSFAVTIMKEHAVVGRVPRELSYSFWTFIQNGGEISCQVTGHRKKGRGLEVPCIYRFKTNGNGQLLETLKQNMKQQTGNDS